jgi:hypothetical protein
LKFRFGQRAARIILYSRLKKIGIDQKANDLCPSAVGDFSMKETYTLKPSDFPN